MINIDTGQSTPKRTCTQCKHWNSRYGDCQLELDLYPRSQWQYFKGYTNPSKAQTCDKFERKEEINPYVGGRRRELTKRSIHNGEVRDVKDVNVIP